MSGQFSQPVTPRGLLAPDDDDAEHEPLVYTTRQLDIWGDPLPSPQTKPPSASWMASSPLALRMLGLSGAAQPSAGVEPSATGGPPTLSRTPGTPQDSVDHSPDAPDAQGTGLKDQADIPITAIRRPPVLITSYQPSSLDVSDPGRAFIKHQEGINNGPDAAGHPTAGYGHKLRGAEQATDFTDEAKAQRQFEADVAEAAQAVRRQVTVPLTQNQFDALASFTYNVGGGGLGNSTLLKKLNAGDYTGAAKEFGKFNKVKDPETNAYKVLNGLTKRRREEAAKFANPGTALQSPGV